MTTPAVPTVGSIWYEQDKRYPAAQRRVEVVSIAGDRVMIRRSTGRITKASVGRFGKAGGYKETP